MKELMLSEGIRLLIGKGIPRRKCQMEETDGQQGMALITCLLDQGVVAQLLSRGRSASPRHHHHSSRHRPTSPSAAYKRARDKVSGDLLSLLPFYS